MMAKIKPLSVIVCEDIRREETGKYIAIGIYTEGINIAKIPGQLAIGLILLAKAKGVGVASFQVEVRPPGSPPVGATVNLEVHREHKPHQLVTLPFPRVVARCDQEGEIAVLFRPKGGRWETLKTMSVTLDKSIDDSEPTTSPSGP